MSSSKRTVRFENKYEHVLDYHFSDDYMFTSTEVHDELIWTELSSV